MLNKNINHGLLICSVLGAVGYLFGGALSLLGTAGLAFVLGVIYCFFQKPDDRSRPGFRFCESTVLKAAIICLAATIQPTTIAKLDFSALNYVLVSVVAPLVLGWIWYTKNGRRDADLFVSVGTAICGSAAIAASLPLINKESSADAANSIAVINFLGMVGLVALPLLDVVLDHELVVVLVGTGLHAVGHVAAAGFSLGAAEGELAMLLKMGRVTLLIPVLMLFTAFQPGKQGGAILRPPAYLMGFIVVLTINYLGYLSVDVRDFLGVLCQALLCVAMAALGMRVEVLKLKQQAGGLLGFGVLCWAAQLIMVTLVWVLFGRA